MQHNRNFELDILRGCGLLLIILAHCDPPKILYQLRDFDVPLMVIVSAVTFAMLYKDKAINIKSFYIKRTKQLILPAWYFLTFFFASLFIWSHFSAEFSFPYTQEEIISSFMLNWGIGFVWILRIFLFIALLTPPLLYFKDKVTNNYLYVGIVLLVYVLYEMTASSLYGVQPDITQHGLWGDVILPIVPYAVLYAYGLKLQEMSLKFMGLVSAVALFFFVYMGFNYYQEYGEVIPTLYLKFPPQLYYLSYAIFCTNILYVLVKYLYPSTLFKTMWTWLSVNSLWVYMWHIYGLFLWDHFYMMTNATFAISGAKYLFTLFFAIAVTQAQNVLKPLIFKAKAKAKA
jgi:hypothetical protein